MGPGPQTQAEIHGTERLRHRNPWPRLGPGNGNGRRRRRRRRDAGAVPGTRRKGSLENEALSELRRAELSPTGSRNTQEGRSRARGCSVPKSPPFSPKSTPRGAAPGGTGQGRAAPAPPAIPNLPSQGEPPKSSRPRLAPGTAPRGLGAGGQSSGSSSVGSLPPPAGLRRGRQVGGAVGRAVDVGGALRSQWGRPRGRSSNRGGHGERGRSPRIGPGGAAKGYLAHVAAQGGHHPAGVPLHPLHQPVVPRAARRVQRRVQGALRGAEGGRIRARARPRVPNGPGAGGGASRGTVPSSLGAPCTHLEVGDAAADLVDVGQRAAVVGAPAVRQPQLLRLQLGHPGRGQRGEGSQGGAEHPQPRTVRQV